MLMEKISELQTRRAENMIWTAAGRHDFIPDFKAYDEKGSADLYWNCIIGAVRKHYDYPKLEEIFRSFQNYEDGTMYENLLWLGLENCTYAREVSLRPSMEGLRRKYAREYLRLYKRPDYYNLYDAISIAHYERIAGLYRQLNGYDEKLLDELEFSADMDTQAIVERTEMLFQRWFQISVEAKAKKKKVHFLLGFKKARKQGKETRFRPFGTGYADHPEHIYGSGAGDIPKQEHRLNTKMSARELREFMETKFGRPIYNSREISQIERELCSSSHRGRHLHFTYGERAELSQIHNGFEALSRQRELLQIERNRSYYQAHFAQNNTAIARLSEKIQNSVLLHLQPSPVKSNAGRIIGAAVWRAERLKDDKVFLRNEQDDMGELCVDILLDASTSQQKRQEIVSTQGYIIAQSLTNCGIACRVMSFCSMTGYTVLRVFRDYDRPQDNKRIFDYVSHGCNRDGLAIAAARHLMNQSRHEYKLLIVLSDVKPNDVIKIKTTDGAEPVFYERQAGINNTAMEVRKARADGISVICVFTGEDDDLPAAKQVYGRDFARIQSMDKLADTVGMLIQNQIKNI